MVVVAATITPLPPVPVVPVVFGAGGPLLYRHRLIYRIKLGISKICLTGFLPRCAQ